MNDEPDQLDLGHRAAVDRIVAKLAKTTAKPLVVQWTRWGGQLVEPSAAPLPVAAGPLGDLLFAAPRRGFTDLSDTLPAVSLLRFLEGFAAGAKWRVQ